MEVSEAHSANNAWKLQVRFCVQRTTLAPSLRVTLDLAHPPLSMRIRLAEDGADTYAYYVWSLELQKYRLSLRYAGR